MKSTICPDCEGDEFRPCAICYKAMMPDNIDKLTSSQESEAIARVSEMNGAWFVQLDLHGNDMDGPYDTEDDAIEAAREAMASGDITGAIA